MDLLLILIMYAVIGFPIVVFLKNYLKVSNRYFYMVIAAIFGFTYFNMAQLFFGYWRLPITGSMALGIKICIVLILYIPLLSKYFRKDILNVLKPSKHPFQKVDYIFMLFFGSLFFSFYWFANTHYHVYYDELTIWLVNAKEIYETGYLRFDDKVMDVHRNYNSFFTIPIVNLYEYFGEVIEGKGILITILHGFFAISLIWERLMSSRQIQRALGLLLASIALIAFNYFWLMCSRYVEVQLAFYVLLFYYLLFKEASSTLLKVAKFSSLLLVCFIIMTTKDRYEIYLPPLLFSWIIYSLRGKKIRSFPVFTMREYIVMGVTTLGFIGLAMAYYYNYSFLNPKVLTTEGETMLLDTKTIGMGKQAFSRFSGTRFIFLIVEAIKFYPLVFISLVISTFLLFLRKDLKIKSYLLLLCIFTYLSVVIFGYIAVNKSLENLSFHRYITHSFFLIPFLFVYALGRGNYSQLLVKSILFVLVPLVAWQSWTKVYSTINLESKFVSGRLVDDPANLESLYDAFLVRNNLPENPKLIVINNNLINQIPALLTNYFLQDLIIGGKVKEEDKLDLYFFKTHKYSHVLAKGLSPDFVPILNKSYFQQDTSQWILLDAYWGEWKGDSREDTYKIKWRRFNEIPLSIPLSDSSLEQSMALIDYGLNDSNYVWVKAFDNSAATNIVINNNILQTESYPLEGDLTCFFQNIADYDNDTISLQLIDLYSERISDKVLLHVDMEQKKLTNIEDMSIEFLE